MSKVTRTVTEIVVHDESDKTMLQDTTTINLVDEGGGMFITLTQYNENYTPITIRLDPREISTIFTSIKYLLSQDNAYVL